MQSASLKIMGALAATLVVASPGFAQKMERGAFLRRPVSSRAQLMTQLKKDPIVAARYARHFGMNDRQLVQYFGTLHRATIPATGRYLVWHVNPDGTIGSKNLMLKKGTGVFMDGMGRVALKESCGNPMLSGEVARRELTEATPRVASRPQEFVSSPPAAPEILETVPEPVAVLPPPVVEVAPPPVEPLVPVPAELAPPPALEPAPGAPQIIGASGGGGGGFLPLLLLPVAGAFALSHGGGGGGGTPPPVPEPTSMVALVTGVGLIAARRRAKKD